MKSYRIDSGRLYIKINNNKYIRVTTFMFNMIVDIENYDDDLLKEKPYEMWKFFHDHQIHDYENKIIQGIFEREVNW